MEAGTNIMEALFTAVTSVVSNIMTLLGTVGESLLSNVIFQIMMGIALLFLVIGIIFRLVKKMRKGGK